MEAGENFSRIIFEGYFAIQRVQFALTENFFDYISPDIFLIFLLPQIPGCHDYFSAGTSDAKKFARPFFSITSGGEVMKNGDGNGGVKEIIRKI